VKIVEKIALPESTGFDAYPADDYEPKPAEEGHYTADHVARRRLRDRAHVAAR
jgi:hypothetical protein